MSTPPSILTVPERLKIITEQWEKLKWQMLCDLRVAAPGIIRTFDAAKQTVTVDIAIRENILQNLVPTPIQIKTLADVPVLMPRAGGYTLTLPVQPGDECLLIFADNCFDAWWQSGGVQNQVDRRRHDLSDAIAILGIWSQPRVLSNYAPNSAQLRSDDGTTIIELNASAINIVATGKAVNVTADTVDITGNSSVTLGPATTIDGKNFLTHTHSGVQSGGSNTGPVV